MALGPALELDPFQDADAYARIRARWLAEHPDGVFPGDAIYGWPPTRRKRSGAVSVAPPPGPVVPASDTPEEPPPPDLPSSPPGDPPATPPAVVPPPRRKRGAIWVLLAGAATLGTTTGWLLWLGRVQHMGQAYQQLAQDSHALHPAPSSHPATSPSRTPTATPLPTALAGEANILTGRTTTNPTGAISFAATLAGPTGRTAVTVVVDTGNTAPAVVDTTVAQAIGLPRRGSAYLFGITGSAHVPVFGTATLVPQGHYVRGGAASIVLPSLEGHSGPLLNGTAQLLLGQQDIRADNLRVVEQGTRWWIGWSGQPLMGLAPSPASPVPSITVPVPQPTASQPYLPDAQTAAPPGHYLPTMGPICLRHRPGCATHVPRLWWPDSEGQAGSGWHYVNPNAPYAKEMPPTLLGKWVWIYQPPKGPHVFDLSYAWGPGQPPVGPFNWPL